MFYETVDRIEIRQKIYGQNGIGDLIESCYNLRKVASNGFCHTKQKRNWGFCSRSCKKFRVGDDEPYEEAAFTYYNDIPEGSKFSGSRAT